MTTFCIGGRVSFVSYRRKSRSRSRPALGGLSPLNISIRVRSFDTVEPCRCEPVGDSLKKPGKFTILSLRLLSLRTESSALSARVVPCRVAPVNELMPVIFAQNWG